MSTLAQKLAIKDERSVGLLETKPHDDFIDLGTVLGGVRLAKAWTEADVVLWPASTEAEIRQGMASGGDDLAKAAAVWVCYKKGNAVEINREKLWIILEDYSWKAVSQVSLDDTWSALRVRPMSEEERG